MELKSNKPKTRFPVRLQKAINDCEKITEESRSNRKMILDRYAAGFFSGRHLANARPINMVWRYLNIMVPFLVSNNPKAMVAAKQDIRLTGFAEILGLALDHLRPEIEYVSTMRDIVLDAMVGAGISKVGMTPKGKMEYGGHVYQSGQAYFERVDLDDWRYDISARSRWDMKFYGNRYKMPLWYIQESGLYKNFDNLQWAAALYGSENNPESISKPGLTDEAYHELQEYVELYDIWMPDEGILVTIPPDGQGDKYLRVVDDFPEKGPFDILGFHWMPGNPMPIPPAYAILDLDDQLNDLMRRIKRQADREKTVLAYEGEAAMDAQQIVISNDGEAVRVDNIDRIKEVTFGGVNDRALAVAQWLRAHVSEQGGNMDMVGGFRPASNTLGQDQMLQANASKVIDDMVSQVHNFAESIEKKLAWYLWHDPLIQIPMIKEMPVVGPVRVQFSDDVKEGDWLDYNIKITPYSLQTTNPDMQYMKLLQWVSQVMLPLIPVAAGQGSNLNVDEFVKLTSKYINLENADVDKLWQSASQPMQVKMGPYQPQQGQAVKSKQPDNRYGQDDGSANFNQQQARAGGMNSVDSAKIGA